MTKQMLTKKLAYRFGCRLPFGSFLVGLLALVGFGLNRASNPMAEIGKPVPDFDLVYFEGYE